MERLAYSYQRHTQREKASIAKRTVCERVCVCERAMGRSKRTRRFVSSSSSSWVLVAFAAMAFLPCATPVNFVTTCSIDQRKPVQVMYDEETDQYVRVLDNPRVDSNGGNNGTRRHLRIGPAFANPLSSSENAAMVPAIYVNDVAAATDRRDLSSRAALFYARQCPCASKRTTRGGVTSVALCPMDRMTCGMDRHDRVKCFNQSSRTVLIRNAWPVVILWYAALVLFVAFTEQGRNARHFMTRRCCKPSLNDELVDRMLDPSHQQRRRGRFWTLRFAIPRPASTVALATDPAILIAHALQQQQQQLQREGINDNGTNETPQPCQLALKTKRYVASQERQRRGRRQERGEEGSTEEDDEDDDYEEDDHENTCAICFGRLEDGDRVGVLPCDHVFHVDCLKTWLPRRNACPLCGTTAATPQYDDDNNNNSNSNDDSNTDEEQGTNNGTERPARQTTSPWMATPLFALEVRRLAAESGGSRHGFASRLRRR